MKNTNLLIGKINAGKTTYLFEQVKNLISNKQNLLIVDNREQYFKTFKKELDNQGYTSLVLNLKDPMKSNSFNPLMLPYNYYRMGKKDKAIDLIKTLAQEIYNDNGNLDSFWSESATNYFIALTLILFKESKDISEINIGSVQTLMSIADHQLGNTTVIKQYFAKLDIMDNIYISGSPIIYAPADTKGGIVSVAKTKINNYCIKEQLLNNLCGNDIDLQNLTDNTAIFIIGDNQLNELGNILINELFYSEKEFTYILDNFDDMPILLSLNNMLNNKVNVYVASRNINLLNDKYDKYIIDRFENVIDKFDDKKLTIGCCDDYPTATNNKASYFNLEN